MEDSDLQSTQYGALIIGSNDDLLTEILIRLPVTSIFRFKSVSKHWRSLLTHTHFTHRYDSNNNNSKSVGVFDRYGMYYPFNVENRSPPPFRSLDFHFNRSDVTIMHSCNGLLLCYAFHNGDIEYYVFNPTTKQLKIIPSVPKRIDSMALAFHQTHCVHYKVVCISPLQPNWNLIQVQVYSSDTGEWKICVESFYVQNPLVRQPVYWNGAFYWAPDYLDSNFFYLKLDVEKLQTFSVPEELTSNDISTKYYGESSGHLHLILKTHRAETSLTVYEILMDHSGWFAKYRIQPDELQGAFSKMVNLGGYNFEVVDVVRGKEEEDTFLVLVTPLKMIRYNVHDKSFKELVSKDNGSLFLSFHRYIETLSSF